MSQSEMWCNKHWDPYKSGERNGILASILIAEEFAEKAATEYDASAPPELERVKSRHAPVCCWLGDETMRDILEKASEDD